MGVSYEQSRGKTTKFKRQEMGDEPIKLFINSQGGHVEAGDTIHDMIKFIKPRVIIIGTGWVASAGITIYLAADKEDRYSLPNTFITLKMDDEKKIEELVKELII